MGTIRESGATVTRAALLIAAVTVILVAFLQGQPALADSPVTTTTTGPIVGPVESADIRLEEATVQAVCYRAFAEYRADLRFVNAGAVQSVHVGFPATGMLPFGFRVWQDGRPLTMRTTSLGQRVSSEEYLVFDVSFPPGETMLSASYVAQPAQIPEADGEYYECLLSFADGWSGTIAKTVVRYRLADNFGGAVVLPGAGKPWDEGEFVTHPGSFKRIDDLTYQWVFGELEPAAVDDTVFAYTPSGAHSVVTVLGSSGTTTDVHGSGDPENAVDGDLRTAWHFTTGKTAWIETQVQGSKPIRELRIVSGDNSESRFYQMRGRPKTIKVVLPDGTSTVITLEDRTTLQKFAIPGEVQQLALEVLDTYPGTYAKDEACIAEIDLGTESSPAFLPFSELMGEPLAGAGPSYYVRGGDSRMYGPDTIYDTPSGAPTPIGVVGYVTQAAPNTFSDGPDLRWIPFVFLGIFIGAPVAVAIVVRVVRACRARRTRRPGAHG